MHQIMKKIILLFIFFSLCKGFHKTIDYQAVILKPTNKISTTTSENLPVANKNVCIRFIDEFLKIEYQGFKLQQINTGW
jgi:RAB protein geranylgeranyltransferase component A